MALAVNKPTEDVLTQLLEKQFEMVGLSYTPDFTKEDGWYRKATWTEEQETEFLKWGKDLLKKHGIGVNQLMLYLLNYGWLRKE